MPTSAPFCGLRWSGSLFYKTFFTTSEARIAFDYKKNVYFMGRLDCHSIHFTTGDCTCKTPLEQVVVRIDENFQYRRDYLYCDSCSADGVSYSYNKYKGILTLTADPPIPMEDFISVLATKVRFRSTSKSTKVRRVSWSYGSVPRNPENGHLYKITYMTDLNGRSCGRNECPWDRAQAICADPKNDQFGLIGYLATVTSKEENDFLSGMHTSKTRYVYLGATDAGTEGQWKWVTGPEGCPDTYDPNGAPALRSACDLGYPLPVQKDPCTGTQCTGGTDLSYTKWSSAQPNEGGSRCNRYSDCRASGQDYMTMTRDGYWGDFSYYASSSRYYACEWGGVGELCMDKEDFGGSEELFLSCSYIRRKSSCKSAAPVGRCEWSGGKCRDGSCYKFDTESECDTDLSCDWDTAVKLSNV